MDLKVLLLLFGLLTVATCQNWCTMQGCAPNSHIACNHTGQFHSRCINPRELSLTPTQKNLILDTFNQKRNQIAAGGFGVFLPAKRMARVTWSDQLAWLASLNVRSCQLENDNCRNTPDFRWAGQNLGAFARTGSFHTTEDVINTVIANVA